MKEKCSQAGYQVGKFIYRGRTTGEYPQKLVTKLASLFIGEETLVNVLKSWSPSVKFIYRGRNTGECPQSWLPSWQVYL